MIMMCYMFVHNWTNPNANPNPIYATRHLLLPVLMYAATHVNATFPVTCANPSPYTSRQSMYASPVEGRRLS